MGLCHPLADDIADGYDHVIAMLRSDGLQGVGGEPQARAYQSPLAG